MAPRSPAFRQFFASYKELSSIYLENRKSNKAPTDHELEKARAFVTFFHAELESYFETVCEQILVETKNKFQAGKLTIPVLGLITFSKIEDLNAGSAIIDTPKKKARRISERFHKAIDKHTETISGNHGVSQGYLAALFTPLGITTHSIDPGWVSELQSIADLRGGFAHKSRKSLDGRPGVSPSDVMTDARKIIFGVGGASTGSRINSLVDFDKWAQDLVQIESLTPTPSRRYWDIRHRFGWWLIRKLGNNQTMV